MVSQPDARSTPFHPLALRADAEIRSLLMALPTKADFELLADRIKETHRWDWQAVREEVQAVSTHLSAREAHNNRWRTGFGH